MIVLKSLFSLFDPSSSTVKMNWMSIMIPMSFIMISKNNKMTIMYKMIFSKITNELMQVMKKKNTESMMIMMMSWMTMIFLYNMSSLSPFSFTVTAQIVMSLSTALPLWLSLTMKNWIKMTNKTMSHLIPTGTPKMLMPLLVLIELSSNLIRPITLSVRLTANLMAGHLIMSLLGESMKLKNSIITITSSSMMMFLEMAVSAIQAYVFTILISLYSAEI